MNHIINKDGLEIQYPEIVALIATDATGRPIIDLTGTLWKSSIYQNWIMRLMPDGMPVIMDPHTYQSLPIKPIPNRLNIQVPGFEPLDDYVEVRNGKLIFNSLWSAINFAKDARFNQVFLISTPCVFYKQAFNLTKFLNANYERNVRLHKNSATIGLVFNPKIPANQKYKMIADKNTEIDWQVKTPLVDRIELIKFPTGLFPNTINFRYLNPGWEEQFYLSETGTVEYNQKKSCYRPGDVHILSENDNNKIEFQSIKESRLNSIIVKTFLLCKPTDLNPEKFALETWRLKKQNTGM